MLKINKIFYVCLLLMLSCLLVVGCQVKPRDEYRLTYEFQLLSEKFQKKINQEAHNILATNAFDLFYLNPEQAEAEQYKFLTPKSLREVNKRIIDSKDKQTTKYDLLSQKEKLALDDDLSLLVKQSQVEQSFISAMKPNLSLYNKILNFDNEQAWFEGINFDYNYFDLGFLDLDDSNYIANVNFDLVFNYKFKNATNQSIKSVYQEEINLTITNQQSIIDELNYLHTELRTDLLKDKFAYAWIDATQLLITDYEKMFNLKSQQFSALFNNYPFEKNFLKYVQEKNKSVSKQEDKKNHELVFKTENRFAEYQQIKQIESIDIAQPNYGAKNLSLNDSSISENLNNVELYKSIFGSLNPYDEIVLENRTVLGNKYLYNFLQDNWEIWLENFRTNLNEHFNIVSDSAIGYGEIYLNDMALYFEQFDYYHPIQNVSYYTVISIDKSEDNYLNNTDIESLNNQTSSIFKTLYLNCFKAIENFQSFFGVLELNWTKVSKAESLIKFDPQANFDFWDSLAKIKRLNVFNVNEKLSLVDSVEMANEKRKAFLNSNNNELFHLQILSTNDLTNFPIIKYKPKEIIWSSFEKINDEFLTVNIGLAFININFIINEEKFYTSEKSLLKI